MGFIKCSLKVSGSLWSVFSRRCTSWPAPGPKRAGLCDVSVCGERRDPSLYLGDQRKARAGRHGWLQIVEGSGLRSHALPCWGGVSWEGSEVPGLLGCWNVLFLVLTGDYTGYTLCENLLSCTPTPARFSGCVLHVDRRVYSMGILNGNYG